MKENPVLKEFISNTGRRLQIVQGDICAETTDAIVNAANEHLAHGGGVAGAISRAGGPSIQQESNKWIKSKGEVKTGQCAFTKAGKLPCKWVIHAVGPVWQDGRHGEDQLLYDSVYNSLKMASTEATFAGSIKRISIPAISSGIFGFPKPRCAEILFRVFFDFFSDHPDSPLRVVRFTNFDEPTVKVFLEQFEKQFKTSDSVVEEEKEQKKSNDNDDDNNNNNSDNSEEEEEEDEGDDEDEEMEDVDTEYDVIYLGHGSRDFRAAYRNKLVTIGGSLGRLYTGLL